MGAAPASPGNGSWGAREGSLEEFPEAVLAGNAPGPRSACPSAPGRTASSPTFVTARATAPSTTCRCASRSEVPGRPGGALDVSGRRRRDRRHASHRHHRAAHGRLRRAATQLVPPRGPGPRSRRAPGAHRLRSCADQNRPQPILRRVVERDPDLFVYLGDNIYGDTEDMAVLRGKYFTLGAAPSSRPCAITAPSSRHGTITTTAPTTPAGAMR